MALSKLEIMRINCPTCEVEFDVSDKQAGQKGLCPDCETKFVISLDPEGGSEILSLGKAPGNKAIQDRDTDDEEDEGHVMRPGDVGYGLKHGEEIVREGGPLARLSVGLGMGLVIGLVIGFVIGWLVWRSPEPNRAPFGDKAKSGPGSPFLQNDVN